MSAIGNLFDLVKAWIECFFDTIKVLYTALSFIIQPNTMVSFSAWMPSLIFSIMSVSLTLIVLLRVIGR